MRAARNLKKKLGPGVKTSVDGGALVKQRELHVWSVIEQLGRMEEAL